MTVKDLEKELKGAGEVKESANFIAPDGALIAKSTLVHNLLHIPYFVMKLDNHREFNVMSEKSFSLRNQKFTLNGAEKRVYDACKNLNMRDQKAIEISRFLSELENEVCTNEHNTVTKDAWGQNDILILLREVIATKAQTIKEEKEILEQ